MADGRWLICFVPQSAIRNPQFSQPGFQILLETFLHLQVFGDNDNGPAGKASAQQCRQKRPGRRCDGGKSQRSALLHAPDEGLPGGSLRDFSEQMARRLC